VIDHPEQNLERLGTSGFCLTAASVESIRVVAEAEGWKVSGRGLEGWKLGRDAEGLGRFRLEQPGSDGSVAWTMAWPGEGRDSVGCCLLLRDGRLFRLLLRGPRDPRFELLGWETPGAYLVVRPAGAGWSIRPEPACGGLEDLREILILISAEILDADADQDSEGETRQHE